MRIHGVIWAKTMFKRVGLVGVSGVCGPSRYVVDKPPVGWR